MTDNTADGIRCAACGTIPPGLIHILNGVPFCRDCYPKRPEDQGVDHELVSLRARLAAAEATIERAKVYAATDAANLKGAQERAAAEGEAWGLGQLMAARARADEGWAKYRDASAALKRLERIVKETPTMHALDKSDEYRLRAEAAETQLAVMRGARPTTPLAVGGQVFVVVRVREQDPPEVFAFKDEQDARACADYVGAQWTETWLLISMDRHEAKLKSALDLADAHEQAKEEWRARAEEAEHRAICLYAAGSKLDAAIHDLLHADPDANAPQERAVTIARLEWLKATGGDP